MSPTSEELLEAAELFRRRALEIDEKQKLETDELPVVEANDGFTLDKLFLDLAKRTRKPKVVFLNERRKEPDWQNQYLLATYFWAESAFTRSGLVLGGNAAGQRKLLEEKWGQVRNALQALSILAPGIEANECRPLFAGQMNLNFGGGPLPNRRGERIGLLFSLEDNIIHTFEGLTTLSEWLDKDIKTLLEFGTGRPQHLQKAMFAIEIGKMWTLLTGEKPSRKTDSVFGKLVSEIWLAGLAEQRTNANFERTLKRVF